MSETIINGIIEEPQEVAGQLQYARGAKGDDGVGISDISKTSTEGKVDTYTITLTDGTTKIFTVTNGDDGTNGISVSDASINANGHLIVTLSDGTSIDAGVAKGDSGVYIGTTPPTDPSIKVWIDTSGEAGDVEMTSNKVTSISSESTDTQYPSAKAVAKAVSTEQKRADNTFANALRGAASGETINLTDVSPNEHTLNVKIHSKNLWQHTGEAAYLDRASYESDTRLYTVNTAGITWFVHAFQNPIPKNTAVSITVEVISGNGTVGIGGYHKENAKNSWQGHVETPKNTDLSGKTYTESFTTNDTVTDLCIFADINSAIAEPIIFRVQYELGTTSTDYTPYVPDLTAVKVTRCGKNLIPYPYINSTQTINGITFTVSSDGSITANGTATSNAYLVITSISTFYTPKGNYILSGCPSGGSSTTYNLAAVNGSGASYTKFRQDIGNGITLSSSGEYWIIRCQIMSGATVENIIFKPQLELGTTATEYEPYITPTEYIPTADGTVNGVTSLYPSTTLTTDTDGVLIDCEYNRDINKAFAALEAAIATNNS